MERTAEFWKAIAERERERKEKEAENQANIFRRILENVGPRDLNGPNNQTTQLIKSRWPPTWIGQKFDKWRLEVEKWKENNKSTEEDKYVDLMESLKKNETIKEFVTKTLVEEIGETRTVERVLNVMAEKYSKTIGDSH